MGAAIVLVLLALWLLGCGLLVARHYERQRERHGIRPRLELMRTRGGHYYRRRARAGGLIVVRRRRSLLRRIAEAIMGWRP